MRLFLTLFAAVACVSLGSSVKLPDYDKEVYGFIYETNASVYREIKWDKLTTIVLVGLDSLNRDLIKYAHDHQVHVQMQVYFRKNRLNDETYKTNFINRKIDLVIKHNLQGINFHFSDALEADSPLKLQLTDLIASLARQLRKRVPDAKLSFNAPWASHNAIGSAVDNRNYDYLAIYDIVDHFVVYSFHISSQQFIGNEYQDEECYAHPTSGIYTSAGGLMSWISYVQNNGSSQNGKSVLAATFEKSLELNSDARDINKIIYLQPWFGIDYVCTRFEQFNRCILPSVWYRGVNCTDRAGVLRTASEANEIFKRNGSTWEYDPHSGTGYTQYSDEKGLHQIWIDNPQALSLKYTFVKEFEIGGTGVYALNFVDYSDQDLVNSLFDPLPNYKAQALN